MNGYVVTDRGQIRTTNEDAGGIFYNEANQLLAVVADGMGGHQAGEVASQLAVTFIEEKWTQEQEITTPLDAEEWVAAALHEMNKVIYTTSLEKEAYEGMGTTVVMTICTPEFVTIAHIGDSRCYMLNDEKLELLTNDHSLVNELIRTGQISEIDAEQHPRKNVLVRALGTEPTINVDIQTLIWEVNDVILLCSDGLTNKVTNEEIESHLRTDKTLREKAIQLRNVANERGGEDNITIAIVQNTTQHEVGDLSC